MGMKGYIWGIPNIRYKWVYPGILHCWVILGTNRYIRVFLTRGTNGYEGVYLGNS